MQIILWRHAEAEDYASSDLARPLTAKGHKQAAQMAAWLTSQIDMKSRQWRVIVSPAVRAQQTAQALTADFETVPGIAPDVSAKAVMDAAHWPQGSSNVIVVGHQPTLGMVAAQLLNGGQGDHYVSIKKGAMWWFEIRQKDGESHIALKAMAMPDTVR